MWCAAAMLKALRSTLSAHPLPPFHLLQSMWFASVSNNILWFAFLKAMNRATLGRWLSGTIVFKVTAKGLQRMKDLPIR
jgi:hypothetical protein